MPHVFALPFHFEFTHFRKNQAAETTERDVNIHIGVLNVSPPDSPSQPSPADDTYLAPVLLPTQPPPYDNIVPGTLNMPKSDPAPFRGPSPVPSSVSPRAPSPVPVRAPSPTLMRAPSPILPHALSPVPSPAPSPAPVPAPPRPDEPIYDFGYSSVHSYENVSPFH